MDVELREWLKTLCWSVELADYCVIYVRSTHSSVQFAFSLTMAAKWAPDKPARLRNNNLTNINWMFRTFWPSQRRRSMFMTLYGLLFLCRVPVCVCDACVGRRDAVREEPNQNPVHVTTHFMRRRSHSDSLRSAQLPVTQRRRTKWVIFMFTFFVFATNARPYSRTSSHT